MLTRNHILGTSGAESTENDLDLTKTGEQEEEGRVQSGRRLRQVTAVDREGSTGLSEEEEMMMRMKRRLRRRLRTRLMQSRKGLWKQYFQEQERPLQREKRGLAQGHPLTLLSICQATLGQGHRKQDSKPQSTTVICTFDFHMCVSLSTHILLPLPVMTGLDMTALDYDPDAPARAYNPGGALTPVNNGDCTVVPHVREMSDRFILLPAFGGSPTDQWPHDASQSTARTLAYSTQESSR